MTVKKGDSDVVTLYFNDDSTCVLKFENREGFTYGLKAALKKMKESSQKPETMAIYFIEIVYMYIIFSTRKFLF